jgi:hypothetical protein
MISLTTQVTYRDGELVIDLPPAYEIPIASFVEKLHGAPAIVTLKKWYQGRTKGQNRAINGFIQQIAMATGQDFDTVKIYCKYEAISRGYPCDSIKDMVIPWSETRINTLQAGMLIDAIQQLAAELGVRLADE